MMKKIKSFFVRVYCHKIDRLFRIVIAFLLRKKRLKDIIIIESHNDFDCNGGAFYDYLIRNGYNKKYKIIWLLKNKHIPILPANVKCFQMKKPSIRKDYYICSAKFILADNYIVEKTRREQKIIYCTHGAGGLKNVKGQLVIPSYVDYVLFQSERYAPIQANQYSMEFPSKRIVYLGYPVHDVLNSKNEEIKKITSKTYNKVIIWMPTFRKKIGNTNRIDSAADYPLGIPLLEDIEQYKKLNGFLKEKNSLIIIKLHPMQRLDDLKISDCTNIKVLTGESVKKLNVDNYRLMSCTDALISDYSGVAYEYLQLNRPIAYVLSDMKEYKLGFVVEDISKLMAGPGIFKYNDLIRFLDDVIQEKDLFKETREKIRDYIYEYHDTNNCKRLASFLRL